MACFHFGISKKTEPANQTFRDALSALIRAVMTDRSTLTALAVQLVTATKALLAAAAGSASNPQVAQLAAQNEPLLLDQLKVVVAQAKLLQADAGAPATVASQAIVEMGRITREWLAAWTAAQPSPGSAANDYAALCNVGNALVTLVFEAIEPLAHVTPKEVLELSVGIAKQGKALTELWKISESAYAIMKDDDGKLVAQIQQLLLDAKLLATASATQGGDSVQARCQVVRSAAAIADVTTKWLASPDLDPVNAMVLSQRDDMLEHLVPSPKMAPVAAPSATEPAEDLDSPEALEKKAIASKHYTAKLLKDWNGLFFGVGLQDFDGGAHGGAALSFKRGDLVAVYDKDDESLWQGVNVQNDSMGYFPCQLVRKIAESTKLLEEPKEAKPKPPLLETLKLTEMAIPASPLSADVATVPSPIITDEQFEAAKAELEKQAPAPDKAGVLKVQLERKKWVESHCVVKDHILFYSKPVKKGGAPQVVHLSLQGLMVRPATHAEVSKHDLALAFVVTPVGSKSSEAHIFAAPDLSERQSWIEILTLASAGASINDVRRSSYDYNSDATKTVRGKSFLGLDSKGNVSETQAGRSPVQREAWMEGLSDEIIAQVQAAAPKGDGKKTERKGILGRRISASGLFKSDN